MGRPFQLIDVFHDGPFSGNPLAVIFDAEGFTTQEMQRIARWLNLSETAFLLQPTTRDADYRVRIFTLERELPFAGHPTLGSCHAWLAAGGTPRSADEIVQECGAGLVRVRRREGLLAFAAPPLVRSGPVDEPTLRAIETVLQLDRSRFVDVQWADNGPGWVAVLLESAEAVLALEPLRQFPTRVDIGVVGPYPPGSPVAFELRAFFSDHKGGIVEDPVTGSLNASAAQWLLASGRARAPYVASQGTRLGRAGRVYIDQGRDGTVWVGGKTTTCFAGEYLL
ncbi:Trans-2,3-dihydro-3-hydroxyanthranilate isomerase [Rubrobacter xylanophilus DSM 9941]|uniref:PhzF family phenazine biosynthesis protein n=1 Tax=Rubrobacter xylanophilus TaxID=49319 RepID=UPI001C63E587|nr:PhzF family phenazine biosynthesis protein [Rubrobacter xylanophilus]QYJ14270.1 Trans-2,3-dihydro-3-hydroxyanthranilate isomerase [Rubrobacter xylanophilus DSM 9941]